MSRPLLTFDCYGTLIDWESGIVEAFRRESERDGRHLDPAALLAAFADCEARAESGSYSRYGQVLAESARCAAETLAWKLQAGRESFLAESLPCWRPFPDTNPSLERLAGVFSLGILSNVDDGLLAETCRHFSVGFDLVVTAEQVRSYKPAHAHWIEARRRMAGLDRRWTHVAQSYYHDVTPALALELPVIWVNRRGQRLRPGQPRPTHETRDLSAAADLVLAGISSGRGRR